LDDGGVDVDGEEVEVAVGLPSDLGEEGVGVARLFVGVLDEAGPAVHLHFALLAAPVGHHGVHEQAGITAQVERLGGAIHHAEVQHPVHHHRLVRADAGPAVRPERADEHETGLLQPLVSDGRHRRRFVAKLLPRCHAVERMTEP
jgi:hypothetical protein